MDLALILYHADPVEEDTSLSSPADTNTIFPSHSGAQASCTSRHSTKSPDKSLRDDQVL